MRITLVAAVAENGVIGRAGGLPWSLPADLAHFRRVTGHRPLVMGRRTYESIGRPLPGRRNVVISRDPAFRPSGVEVVDSPMAATRLLEEAEEIMVIGGATIYEAFLEVADRLLITFVHAHPEGDVRFPDIAPSRWIEVARERRPADAANPYDVSFVTFERRVRSLEEHEGRSAERERA